MDTEGAKEHMQDCADELRAFLDEPRGWPRVAKEKLEAVYKEIARSASAMSEDGGEWAAVSNYEGVYEASKSGKIRRIDGKLGPKPIKTQNTAAGYPFVHLSSNGRDCTRTVHLLVIEAFYGGKPANGWVVNHKDGNRQNNHISNLEWVTYAENSCHAQVLGLKPTKKKREVSDQQYSFIRKCEKLGMDSRTVARMMGVPKGIVDGIWNQKTLASMLMARPITTSATFLKNPAERT